ncbi:helix-turn-helix transcriptional regulator [Cryobacterium sp. TMT1-3]|uniref:helix-turn-helix transcriptional regulator n=1 Tax=Cryobacterium sp. TMT1-3 TaxID=1259237 RepID=UPI001F54744D|nr:helix-turn-helix transcriptional regulator [Cryobacterium sp. TMT1-3]
MTKIRAHLVRFREPALGALFFTAWFVQSSNRIVDYVPSRTDTFLTNPYAVFIAAGFGLAIALCRVRPGTALSLTGGLLVLQLLFWPARFSQVSWVAYLALVFLVVGISAFSRVNTRRVLLGLSIVCSVAVSALLNVPFLSMSGVWGTINGKEAANIEVVQGFLIWSVVGLLLTLGAWHIGSRLRVPAMRPEQESSSELPTGAAAADTEIYAPDPNRPHPDAASWDSIAALSSREREIFLLAARGLSNSDIAHSAHIGESTVKTHLSSILTKLGFTSRAQIVAHAYQSRLLR